MSIRNYNAFLRAAKKKHGITHKKAQSAYRNLSRRLRRPARGVDVRKHPRLTKQAIQSRKRGKISQNRPTPRAGKKSGGLRRITTISEWTDAIRSGRYGVPETQLVVSSADYGRGKKGRR